MNMQLPFRFSAASARPIIPLHDKKALLLPPRVTKFLLIRAFSHLHPTLLAYHHR